MSEEILVVDIGNTSTSVGVYARGRISGRQRVPTAFDRASAAERIIHHAVRDKTVATSVLCSVVPKANTFWRDVLKNGRQSTYATWFDILDWGPPLRWRSWDGENGNLIFVRIFSSRDSTHCSLNPLTYWSEA